MPNFADILHGLKLWDIVDVVVVASLIYWVLRLIRGTRAVYMLFGLTLAIGLYWFSSVARLYTLHWLLSHVFGSLLFLVIVLFQNDIRRVLTQIGRTPLFSRFVSFYESELIEEVVRTSVSLANKKIGALIVLERNADLSEYVEMGIRMDAIPSKELITSLFIPISPVHDGAILIQKGRISAAGCFLPLTMNPQIDLQLGTRHRAAIGLSEETDAVVIVVSEEQGWISLVVEGKVIKGLDGPALRKLLLGYFEPRKSFVRRYMGRRGAKL